ncbi:Transmembrane protein 41A [Intoshia linei]|uniref:Transmembrane protein 41A n=1 Tax=Intoshia linei TaxID=1819745 RepID=A0A177BAR9_9BILA|nr:Transmembrane protein 41A [Intoshia linei]
MNRIFFVPVIFTCATLLLYYLSFNAPSLKKGNITYRFTFPTRFQHIKDLSTMFHTYKHQHYLYVFVIFVSVYLYKQTFAIPGSVLMNIIAGVIYGMPFGFFLCCILTSIGSSLCYILSYLCGSHTVNRLFSHKLINIRKKIQEHRHSLLFFLLFTRLFPMSPNWLMNISAPHVNIPLSQFFTSVLLGLMPYNYICVQAGAMINEYQSIDDIFSVATLIKLCSMALAMIIPGTIINRLLDKRRTK